MQNTRMDVNEYGYFAGDEWPDRHAHASPDLCRY